MSTVNTIDALSQFCKQSSGDTQVWQGVSGTYHWNIGKLTRQGILNGVVRKLAGIDVTSGTKIWVVAGSFKLDSQGNILRFTGLARKDQLLITRMADVVQQAHAIQSETAEV
jgi:hypothetical protein